MANNIKSLKSAFNVKLGQLKLYLKYLQNSLHESYPLGLLLTKMVWINTRSLRRLAFGKIPLDILVESIINFLIHLLFYLIKGEKWIIF